MPAEVEPRQEADTEMRVESDKRCKGLALVAADSLLAMP